jgi:hypothetical protein
MKRSLDLLSEGKKIPPARLRRHDEFKELAESLERLRITLKNRGLLKSEDETNLHKNLVWKKVASV